MTPPETPTSAKSSRVERTRTDGRDGRAPGLATTGASEPTYVPLRLVPVTFAEANEYVTRFHRHNGRLPTSIIRVGVADNLGAIRGVAIAGLPKGRGLCDGATMEVSRVCSDSTPNVCSMLYGACVRAARALGYWRVVTYTLSAERGASLRASGWNLDASLKGRSWVERHGEGYADAHDTSPKDRWVILLGEKPPEALWPSRPDDGQASLFGEAS